MLSLPLSQMIRYMRAQNNVFCLLLLYPQSLEKYVALNKYLINIYQVSRYIL